nr:integrase, catalytic region, zinc finger, CCHC-type, peptidase aspartic, catalytic [Tanacetum cinerariifolium]
MALGYQNSFYIKQAQKKQQSLYDGKVLLEKHDPHVVHDSKETLQLAQESREKMKQLNKEIKPANYTKINHLSGVLVLQSAMSRLDNNKTRRPQHRSNTKNDRVSSASKSSRSKNKDVKVEEHHRNLPHSKKNKHILSACNNSKIDSQDVISKVVCAKCKKCLNSVNHDVCLNNYVNGKKSRGCFKHMTGNLKFLINFVWKFMGTVCFGNDHVAAILGYGDL